MLRPASATKSDPTEAWVLVLVPFQSFFRLPLGTIPEYYASPLNLGNVSEAKAVWISDSSNGVVCAEVRAPLANKSRREKMKKVIAGPVLALAVSLGALLMFAHASSAAPQPAPSASQVVLSQWNEIGRKLIAMAEDFPEDKYDFKPTPAVRTFAEQLLHVSSSMYYFTDHATG